MNSARPPLPPRARRRRSIQQRQTTIIGGLVAVLLLAALIAAAVWAQLLPLPFDRPFSVDPESSTDGVPAADAPPCPPAGATPRGLNEITSNVFNSTDRSGLAGTTAQELTSVGVVVNQQGNYSGSPYPGAVRLVSGANGVVSAYSLARVFPVHEIVMDDRTDESVDVIIGIEYEAMIPPEEMSALDPAQPLVAPEGCLPVEEVPSG